MLIKLIYYSTLVNLLLIGKNSKNKFSSQLSQSLRMIPVVTFSWVKFSIILGFRTSQTRESPSKWDNWTNTTKSSLKTTKLNGNEWSHRVSQFHCLPQRRNKSSNNKNKTFWSKWFGNLKLGLTCRLWKCSDIKLTKHWGRLKNLICGYSIQ